MKQNKVRLCVIKGLRRDPPSNALEPFETCFLFLVVHSKIVEDLDVNKGFSRLDTK